MLHHVARLILLLAFLATIGGCAMVSITSDPPGAEISYSRTGIAPWYSWPPESSQPATTPAREWIRADPYYFVRVHKNGYYSTAPLLLDVEWLRRQRLHFRLDPTPELFARQQRERGLVLFEGQWVNPKQLDLVEDQGKWMRREEKFKREQEAKGLVFHEPLRRWMTPQELEKIEAEEKRAQGLVRFKNQWVSPREADLQKLIDRQAERIAASTVTYALRIERIGLMFAAGAELRITDLSGHPLEVLLSGPQSRRLQVPPYNTIAIQTLPGTYTLVIRQADSRRTGLVGVGTIRMAPKSRYSTTYRGAPATTRIPIVSPATGQAEVERPSVQAPGAPSGSPPSPSPPTPNSGSPGGNDRSANKPPSSLPRGP